MSRSLALAAAPRLDLATASREDLLLALQRYERAGREGWLDRVYTVHVELSSTQGQIYTVDGGRTYDEEAQRWRDRAWHERGWKIQGSGFDALNRAAGVTIVTVGEPRIEVDGMMPRSITLQRVAIGPTATGATRVAPVTLTIRAAHYRLETIGKAAYRWAGRGADRRRVAVEGIAFGARAQLAEDGRLGAAHQIWMPTERVGEVEVGYALDLTQPAVREIFESGATFAKNLERRAVTIAGRLASRQWHGYDGCAPSWLSERDGDVIATVPVTGYRSDLSRGQIEEVAGRVAEGMDVVDALGAAGVRGPIRRVEQAVDVTPEIADEDLAVDDDDPAPAVPPPPIEVREARPAPTPAAQVALRGAELGLRVEEQRAAVARVTGEPSRASVTDDTLRAAQAELTLAAEGPPREDAAALKRRLRDLARRVSDDRPTGEDFAAVLAGAGGRAGLTTYDAVRACEDAEALACLVADVEAWLRGGAAPREDEL